jgi:archaemetzincin
VICILLKNGSKLHARYIADFSSFVFGQAALQERVGVFSFARYMPGFFEDDPTTNDSDLMIKRGFKICTHEILHMFGMKHCVFYGCLLTGANHFVEMDRQKMNLCPICLRKLHKALGCDMVERYNKLAEFYKSEFPDRNIFAEEYQWVQDRLNYILSD